MRQIEELIIEKASSLNGYITIQDCELLGVHKNIIFTMSKNNLLDADFISEFLVKNKDNKAYESMAAPGRGTLSNRMIPLKNNLKAKTGTLSDISAIAGYLTSKSGQKYAFAILINDPSTKDFQKKSFEDYLIREMYYGLK